MAATLYELSDRDPEGRDKVTRLRALLGRFDRWTLDVFNPQYPLPAKR